MKKEFQFFHLLNQYTYIFAGSKQNAKLSLIIYIFIAANGGL